MAGPARIVPLILTEITMSDRSEDTASRVTKFKTDLTKRLKLVQEDKTGMGLEAFIKQLDAMDGILAQDSTLLVSQPGIGANQD